MPSSPAISSISKAAPSAGTRASFISPSASGGAWASPPARRSMWCGSMRPAAVSWSARARHCGWIASRCATSTGSATARSIAASVLGDALPPRVRRAFESWRYGPAAFKVDFSVHGGVPWTNETARRAGTVHLGGTLAQVVAAEAEVAAGRMPARPFVLVGQQYLADPSRSRADLHPLWTYAHVPHGFEGDATEAIVGQVERFAPGFRDRISRTFVRSATELARYNRNYVGGDIATGANSLRQLLVRPRPSLAPYLVGIAGVYLSSAATPPGAGVHGMAGYHVAQLVLRDGDHRGRR